MTGLDGVGGLVGRAPFVLRTFPRERGKPLAGRRFQLLAWESMAIVLRGNAGWTFRRLKRCLLPDLRE